MKYVNQSIEKRDALVGALVKRSQGHRKYKAHENERMGRGLAFQFRYNYTPQPRIIKYNCGEACVTKLTNIKALYNAYKKNAILTYHW